MYIAAPTSARHRRRRGASRPATASSAAHRGRDAAKRERGGAYPPQARSGLSASRRALARCWQCCQWATTGRGGQQGGSPRVPKPRDQVGRQQGARTRRAWRCAAPRAEARAPRGEAAAKGGRGARGRTGRCQGVSRLPRVDQMQAARRGMWVGPCRWGQLASLCNHTAGLKRVGPTRTAGFEWSAWAPRV